MKKKEDKIIIYTDGAARGNPGKAGWAAVILFQNNGGPEHIHEIGGASKHETNNIMELTAPIKALKYLKHKNTHDFPVEIFSDSKYVILGITEWIFNWQKNNWCNAAKKPVLNKKLWKELFRFSQLFKIKWTYVQGHVGDKYNERADKIATNFADGYKIKLKNGK